MKSEDKNVLLYQKAKREYTDFLKVLWKMRKNAFNKAYETAIKKFVLNIFKRNIKEQILSDDVVATLLKLNYPLDLIYNAWSFSERGVTDIMLDCIECFGKGMASVTEKSSSPKYCL